MRHPILLVGLVILGYFSGYKAKDNFSQYWEEHIGLSQPPHWLASKASPLSFHQTAAFIKLMDENKLISHMEIFCKQANVACSTNAQVKKTTNGNTLPPIVPWNLDKLKYEYPNEMPLSVASQGGLPYFRKSMVKEGDFMPIPDLRDPMSYRSFLPRSLALKIPFSLAQIKELKKLFHVDDESNMDKYIRGTLEVCEDKSLIQGEQHSCATSAEDFIDFIVKKLGKHVHMWSTENIEGSYENVTIGVVKLLYGNLSEPPVLCHSLPFPFQVYYCHFHFKSMRKMNHVIMACHYDTSAWNPNHLAFKLIGFGPGITEVCHWINKNGVALTKNNI